MAGTLRGHAVIRFLKDLIENHPGGVRNIIVGVMVFGLSEVVEVNFFNCPPDNFKLYAICFFTIPAVFIFIAAILLRSSFWNVVRGCCYHEGPKDLKKRFCRCLTPRWCCSWTLVEIVCQSFSLGLIWVFWAFLQRDYYICYKLGGEKVAEVENGEATPEQAEEYANVGRVSQMIALFGLLGVLLVAFAVLSVDQCCCEKEISSLPSDEEVERLESEAAVKTFRDNTEQVAREQGEKYADEYFPVTALIGQHGAQEEQSNLKTLVIDAKKKMAARYPQTTGDKSQPYVNYTPSEQSQMT